MYRHIKLQATLTGNTGDDEVLVVVVEQTHLHRTFSNREHMEGWFKHTCSDGFRIWLGSQKGAPKENGYNYKSHAYIMLRGDSSGHDRSFVCSLAMWDRIKEAIINYNTTYSG